MSEAATAGGGRRRVLTKRVVPPPDVPHRVGLVRRRALRNVLFRAHARARDNYLVLFEIGSPRPSVGARNDTSFELSVTNYLDLVFCL